MNPEGTGAGAARWLTSCALETSKGCPGAPGGEWAVEGEGRRDASRHGWRKIAAAGGLSSV